MMFRQSLASWDEEKSAARIYKANTAFPVTVVNLVPIMSDLFV